MAIERELMAKAPEEPKQRCPTDAIFGPEPLLIDACTPAFCFRMHATRFVLPSSPNRVRYIAENHKKAIEKFQAGIYMQQSMQKVAGWFYESALGIPPVPPPRTSRQRTTAA